MYMTDYAIKGDQTSKGLLKLHDAARTTAGDFSLTGTLSFSGGV